MEKNTVLLSLQDYDLLKENQKTLNKLENDSIVFYGLDNYNYTRHNYYPKSNDELINIYQKANKELTDKINLLQSEITSLLNPKKVIETKTYTISDIKKLSFIQLIKLYFKS